MKIERVKVAIRLHGFSVPYRIFLSKGGMWDKSIYVVVRAGDEVTIFTAM